MGAMGPGFHERCDHLGNYQNAVELRPLFPLIANVLDRFPCEMGALSERFLSHCIISDMHARIGTTLALFVAIGLIGAGCSEPTDSQQANESQQANKAQKETSYETAPEWTDARPASEQKREPQPLNEKVFVDAREVQQLASRSEKPATVIDARTRDAYNAGHYPGAIHSGNEAGGYKPFKDPKYNDIIPRDVKQLQETAREMGVYNDRPVIIYAKEASKRTGRLHWDLEYLGHGEVYIYNPGYETLMEKTGVEAETKPSQARGDFVVRRRESVRASHEEIRRVVNGDAGGVLIDTRRTAEFTGEEVRAPRGGYIPKAKHYHWEAVFKEDGTLRPRSELKSELQQKGLMKDGTMLVPYCQTGTRSGVVYSVLRWVGASNVQNYDGSWARWARLDDAPVAQDGKQRLASSSP